MTWLEQIVLLPSRTQVALLDPLVLLMLVFFLPYVGTLLVTSVGALLTGQRQPVLSRRLTDLVLGSPALALIAGLLPLLVLFFLLHQALLGTAIPIAAYLLRVGLLFLAGYALLALYARTRRAPFGALGSLLLLGAAFHFLSILSLLAHPEFWEFEHGPLPFLFSIQPVIHLGLFLVFSSALAGAGLLVATFRWPERREPADPADAARLRALGWGLTLGGALGVPPLLLWDLYTAPFQVLTRPTFTVALAILVAAALIAVLTLIMIRGGHTRRAALVFLLALAASGLFAHRERLWAGNANREGRRLLANEAQTRYATLVAEREALYTTDREPDLALGGEIFAQRCTACHAFDRKVVGPPYDEVLSKYAGDAPALAAFIQNPVRVNPDYPPMPNQGLRRFEAESVALYLLEEVAR